MLILLVTCIGFTAFTFSADSPQFRCHLTSLLLLTLVNFRWILSSSIPSISYLTLLDKYSIGSIIFLFALFIWHSFAGSLHNEWSLISQALKNNNNNNDQFYTNYQNDSMRSFINGSMTTFLSPSAELMISRANMYDKLMFYGFMFFYFLFNMIFLIVFVRILRSISSIHDKHKTNY